MVRSIRIYNVVLGLMLGILIMAGGCKKAVRDYDEMESRDPLVRRARSKVREGDKNAAVNLLNRAIEKKPCLAQAHLDIALLYDDFKKDYIRAIYHYQRYLELRPQTEKKEMIEDWIRGARMSFITMLSDQLPGRNKRVYVLEQENADLKVALQRVRKNLAGKLMDSSAGVSGTSIAQKEVLKPQPEEKSKFGAGESFGRIYRVKPNDTLSTIAAKVYEDPNRWKLLYHANRKTLDEPGMLRVGQVLIIPEIESGGDYEQ